MGLSVRIMILSFPLAVFPTDLSCIFAFFFFFLSAHVVWEFWIFISLRSRDNKLSLIPFICFLARISRRGYIEMIGLSTWKGLTHLGLLGHTLSLETVSLDLWKILLQCDGSMLSMASRDSDHCI